MREKIKSLKDSLEQAEKLKKIAEERASKAEKQSENALNADELRDERNTLADKAALADGLQSRVDEQNQTISDLRAQKATIAKEKQEAERVNGTYQGQFKVIEGNLQDAKDDLIEKEKLLVARDEKITFLKEQQKDHAENVKSLEGQLKAASTTISTHEQTIATLKERSGNFDQIIKELKAEFKAELAEVRKTEAKAAKEATELEMKNEQLSKEVNDLTAKLTS